MKITFLTENFYCGGLDSFLLTLINHWPDPQDELSIICNPGHPGYEVIKAGLLRPCKVSTHGMSMYSNLVVNTRGNNFLRNIRRLLSPLLRIGYFVYYLMKLRSLFSLRQIDRLVVVNGGHPGGDTCRAAIIAWKISKMNCPLAIYNFHNLAESPRWFERCLERLLDAVLVASSSALIGVSKICAESLYSRIGYKAMGKVSWIYNGISVPKYFEMPYPSLREELNIPRDGRLCLMLGTYEPRKGHDFLLQAFKKVVAEIPDAYLVMCGYGYPEEIKHVEHLVNWYGLTQNVRLQGFRAGVDVLLRQSDMLLVASQSHESFGLTSVEAMANRIPVVATRVGGIPEVVEDGDGGFCVDPDDVEGYSRRVIEFLKNKTLRENQAERGFQRYQRLFSASRMVNEYAQVIRSNGSSLSDKET